MTDGPQPLTKQRSPWERIGPVTADAEALAVYERRVHDGTLRAIVGREPIGPGGAPRWHLSISHAAAGRGHARRYPNWDEIADARYRLLVDGATFALLLPRRADYVAVHPTTFHLHEIDDPT